MIVLDTSVLSLAFRRRSKSVAEPAQALALKKLIQEKVPVFVPGVVLQELLSGVKTETHFRRLGDVMKGFPLLLAEERHHLSGARIANACRRGGKSFSTVDCLIAAQALDIDAALFTTDSDFEEMAPHCRLKLYGGA